jgi:hypothetical protein
MASDTGTTRKRPLSASSVSPIRPSGERRNDADMVVEMRPGTETTALSIIHTQCSVIPSAVESGYAALSLTVGTYLQNLWRSARQQVQSILEVDPWTVSDVVQTSVPPHLIGGKRGQVASRTASVQSFVPRRFSMRQAAAASECRYE